MLFKAAVIKWHHIPSGDFEYELQGMWEEVVVA